jgi:hypothetical protein
VIVAYGPHQGMSLEEYRRLVARGERYAWTKEDERLLRERVARCLRRASRREAAA